MSYEKEVMRKFEKGEEFTDKLDIPILKYLWDASPLSFLSQEGHHDFFKKIPVLSSLSDNEIRLFSKFLHKRDFERNEVVFNQGDSGYGMYFIYAGSVNVLANNDPQRDGPGDLVVKLTKTQFFGEMGLIEEFNRRNASVIAAEKTTLLGIFKPDMDLLLETYPVIGAKFLRETAFILASRIGQLTREIKNLKNQILQFEKKES